MNGENCEMKAHDPLLLWTMAGSLIPACDLRSRAPHAGCYPRTLTPETGTVQLQSRLMPEYHAGVR